MQLRMFVMAAAAALCLPATAAPLSAQSTSSPSATRGVRDEAAIADSARAYLVVALDSLQRTAMRRDATPWDIVRDSAFLLAAGARTPAETYGALNWALNRVDRHSFLQAPFPWVNAGMVDEDVAYLRIPFHNAGSTRALSDTLQHALRQMDGAGACGWIVDLRMNGGGNVWPMYAGIAPLLGDSVLSVTRSGERLVPGAWYSGGTAWGLNEETGERVAVATASNPHVLRDPNAPVAVLIDAATGSSGEAIAIAFRTRANTRFFGAPTAGLTTANRGVQLADGANMVVTVEGMTDRSGREYTGPIEPDVAVPMPAGFWPSPRDLVARTAAQWLRAQPACTR